MNFGQDWHGRRPGYPTFGMYHHHYSTDIKSKLIEKNPEVFPPETLLNHLSMLENPLQKNLADTLHNYEVRPHVDDKSKLLLEGNVQQKTKEVLEEKMEEKIESQDLYPYSAFSGIGSFFSGVFNVLTGGTFRRAKTTQHLDTNNCSKSWLNANTAAENTTDMQYESRPVENNINVIGNVKEMADCKTAVAQCENKIARVKSLLASKTVPVKTSPRYVRRPKKLFVQPDQVSESSVEAIITEDVEILPQDPTINYRSPNCVVTDTFIQVVGGKFKIVKPDIPKIQKTGAELAETEVKVPKTDVEVLKTRVEVLETVKIKTDISKSRLEVAETPIMKLDLPKTSLEIPETVQEDQETKLETEDMVKPIVTEKPEIISSCEDKMSKLKALISERRRNNRMIHDSVESESSPEVKPKIYNRKYKNPNRISGGRVKTNSRKTIEEDMTFANEVDVESPESSPNHSPIEMPKQNDIKYSELVDKKLIKNSSETEIPKLSNTTETEMQLSSTKQVEIPKLANSTESTLSPSETKDSPIEYFNEVTGRFHNNSTTESEDSFQIVFTDSPQNSPRTRNISDCDSEDSFIIFEDHDCYTSTDVFGESDGYTSDEEDGKISHVLSRTISDLTDERLYQETQVKDSVDEVDHVCSVVEKSLIIDAAKKLKRLEQPPKTVRFSEGPPKVHVMRVWAFAARQARKGHWEQHALDRDRFKRRIADVDMAISWVLKPQHRSRVKFQRFMPWWHAQRRKEAAEKKEQEERIRIEEERIKKEKEEEEQRIKDAEQKILDEIRKKERIREAGIRKLEEIANRDKVKQKKRSNFVGNEKLLPENEEYHSCDDDSPDDNVNKANANMEMTKVSVNNNDSMNDKLEVIMTENDNYHTENGISKFNGLSKVPNGVVNVVNSIDINENINNYINDS